MKVIETINAAGTASKGPMFTISNYDYDCTKRCTSKKHGAAITAALTKRAISNDQLAAYIAKICRNFAEITDNLGRTALHLASSVERYAIVEWLLNHGALINVKDAESGSSPLHRAVFYGCIDSAVLLMRYGANLEISDSDARQPLQHVCKLNDLPLCRTIPENNEILVWGSNKNYNLGEGNDQANNTPHFIDMFRKNNICIVSVAVGAYHSLFLDAKGIVYSVGHGKGGRLGIGSENSLPSPKRVKMSGKDDKVISISCSKNHSLLLTSSGKVFAAGLNTDQQLGLKPAPELLTSFKEVPAFSQYGVTDLVSVIAQDHHSLAYSYKELFVWGANHGQFGGNSSTHILLPKQINMPEKTIVLVDSNNVAIACCTSPKQVYILYNNKIKSVRSPTLENIKSICVSGGEDLKKEKSAELKLLLLTNCNNIYIWYDDMQKFLRCTIAYYRVLDIEKIIYKSNKVMILSQGDIYSGNAVKVPVQAIGSDHHSTWHSCPFKQDLCIDQKIRFEVKRITTVDRVVDVTCDDDFESFAVLQESSRKYYVLPQLMAEEYNFKNLLNEASEFDSIHDIVFHVGAEIFYAHKLIVFSRSSGLKAIVGKFKDKDVYLNFSDLTGKMFEFILKHIYANYLLTEEDFDEIFQSMGPHYQGDRCAASGLFLNFVKKFELSNLANYVTSYQDYLSSEDVRPIEKQKYRFNRLKPTSFPKLQDVTITCAGNREIRAHKCILVTRLEYFNMMFNNSWCENKIINLSTIPYEYMSPIIDFLYTADVENFRRQNYSESFLYNMIVICDQFFINRLRKVCEILVLDKISIRKCGEMLDFACAYNCSFLKTGCLDFICQNLARVLMQRSLEVCEPEALHSINAHYRQIFKNVFDFRQITPDSSAVDDDLLKSFTENFSVDLNHKMSGDSIKKTKNKIKMNKTAQSKRNYEKEAIFSMKELYLSENSFVDTNGANKNRKSDIENEVEKINKTVGEANSWIKLHDKKNAKKSPTVVAAIKVNNILKEEKRPENDFVSLNQVIKTGNKTPMKNQLLESPIEKPIVSPPTATSFFNLGDFTPIKGDKISQKQRKRLSSESKTEIKTTPSKPISIPERPNAWGVMNNQSCDQTSLADLMKSPKTPPTKVQSEVQKTNNPTPSTSAAATSFTQIIQDERRQKEYVEKMRSKPLVLTQIEEAAITELKEFYNVDNVDDEIITIERKRVPFTVNFAVWQYN